MGALAGLAGLAKLAAVGGTLFQVAGTIKAGNDADARAQYEAKVQEQQADEAKAASQRDATAQYRQGQQILSQQRAGIAGSGGSLADASVIDLMGDTAAEADLAARTEIYKGEQQARGYNDAAVNSRISGKKAVSAAYIGGAGSMFSGISSMYSRFGEPAGLKKSTDTNLIYGKGTVPR